jgi:hypothetical protein
MTIGPRFLEEIKAAGLMGLPFSWGDDGDVQGWDNLTAEQSVLLRGVVDAHDPTLAASDEYKRLRAAEYNLKTTGEQFGMQYDDAQNGTTTWVDWQTEIKNRIPE